MATKVVTEVVSQAGKIVGLSDSLPLNKLAEAGPEESWTPTKKPIAQSPTKLVLAVSFSEDMKSNNVT